MNKEQALNVIEQALNLATQKGAFQLADVQTIIAALTILKAPDVKDATNDIKEKK